jgi:DnaJ domain
MNRKVIVKYFVILIVLAAIGANFNLIYMTLKLIELKMLVEISPDYYFSDVIKLIETRPIKEWSILEMIRVGNKIGYLINPALVILVCILIYIKKIFNKSSILMVSLLLVLPFSTEIWLIGFGVFFGYQVKKLMIKKDPPKKEIPHTPPVDPNLDIRTDEQVLGVNMPLTKQSVKLAYRTQSTRFHPDKWNDRPDLIKKTMEEEQKKINLAYQRLSKRVK